MCRSFIYATMTCVICHYDVYFSFIFLFIILQKSKSLIIISYIVMELSLIYISLHVIVNILQIGVNFFTLTLIIFAYNQKQRINETNN